MDDWVDALRSQLEQCRRERDSYAARFRNTFEKNADGLIIVDAQGLIRVANPAAEVLFDRGADELTGSAFGFPVIAGETAEIDVIRRDGTTAIVEMRATATEWDGETVYLASLRDISDHKAMAEALREANDTLRALIQASPTAIIAQDAAGIIRSWNPAAERIFGWKEHELIGRSVLDVSPEAAAEMAAAWRRVRGDQIATDLEARCRTRDGAPIAISISAAPLYDETGVVTGMMAVVADITERRRMEEEVRRAQRLEIAGRIAGQVAHDFNNLLQPLVGYPALIKRSLPADHPALRVCDTMIQAARRLAAINDDLLTLGRRGHFKRDTVDLNRCVEQAVSELASRLSAFDVQLELAPDLLPVSAAEAQLLRAICNLIANALDAMGETGRLTLTTDNIYVDLPIGTYSRVGIGEHVRLRIRDTGGGIPPEVRDQIFDPFFTTKDANDQRGTGLGLTVVQAVIQDHGGIINVESEPGMGTTFSLYLPVSRSAPTVPTPETAPGGSERVLVVDDDATQRDVIALLVSSLGYHVHTVGSGEEALAHLRDHPVDLLVLDMLMPDGLDGTETYRRALAIRPGLPAIVVSGFADVERVQGALALGASAHLRKPVTLETLGLAIRRALEGTPSDTERAGSDLSRNA